MTGKCASAATICLIASALVMSAAETKNTRPHYSLPYTLVKIGQERGIFFTVEELPQTSGQTGAPTGGGLHLPDELARDSAVRALESDERIKSIEAETPSIAFGRTARTDPSVVHVIDNRAGELKSPLDEKLSNFEFDGTIVKLIQALQARGIRIALLPGGTIGDPLLMRNDHGTVVHVRAQQQTVRDILSNCVPLKGYSHVLWMARTITQDGAAVTYIHFLGPELRTPVAGKSQEHNLVSR